MAAAVLRRVARTAQVLPLKVRLPLLIDSWLNVRLLHRPLLQLAMPGS